MFQPGSPPCVCRDHEKQFIDRPEVFLPIIAVMFVSLGLPAVLARFSWGLQVGTVIPYTAFIVLATFSAQRGQQPYFFECPFVHAVIPQLIRRHIGFVAAIEILETIALYSTRYMPPSWLVSTGRDGSTFYLTLGVTCLFIAGIQLFTNRSLLERAHLNKYAGSGLLGVR